MGEVKRYEAVHLRYDDNNIRYGDGCEVEVVLAADYVALEAELARVKGEYEWVASINTALDESNQSAWTENVKLRAELERRAVDGWKLVPVEPTPEMVSAAEEAHMPFGDMDIALRMAILSAPSAPATVQGVNQQLLEALEAILPFIPNTSAAEGGAARYSENVRAADKVRAAIAAARKGERE